MNRNVLSVIGCYALWGILPIYWKLLSSLSSFYVMASRIFWSLIFITVFLLCRRDMGKIAAAFKDRRQVLLSALAGVLISVNWGCYIYCVSSGHVLDGSLAYYLNPIVSVALAALGILFTIVFYHEIPYLALVIAFSFGVYGTVKKKVDLEPSVSLFLETLFVSPFALFLIIWMESRGTGAIGTLQGASYLLLLGSGIITAVPLLLYAKGVPHIPFSLSGILMFINPTLQMLLGVFLYHEPFTAADLVLFICVWVSILLFVRKDAPAKSR